MLFFILLCAPIGHSEAQPNYPIKNQSILSSVDDEQLFPIDSTQSTGDFVLDTTITLIANKSQEIQVNGDQTITLPQLEMNSTLSFEQINSRSDLFKFGTSFIDTLNQNSTGTIKHSKEKEKYRFEALNEIFLAEKIIQANFDLLGTEELFFNVSGLMLNLDYSPGIFGYAELEFSFDTGSMHLLLNYTDSYVDLGFSQNSSTSLKIIPKNGQFQLDPNILFSTHNITSPSKLFEVTVRTYYNQNYDLILDVDNLNFWQLDNFESFLINNETEIFEGNSTFNQFSGRYTYITNPVASTLITMRIVTFVDYSTLISTNLSPTKEDLSFNSFLPIPLPQEFTGILTMPSGFVIQYVNGNSTTKPSNKIEFTEFSFPNISINGSLRTEDNIAYEANDPIQGSKFLVNTNNDHEVAIGVMINSRERAIKIFNSTNNEFNAIIPLQWSKGMVRFIFVTSLGFYQDWESALSYSPATYIGKTEIEIEPTQNMVIPILIQNITSNETLKPEMIEIYSNGNLKSVEREPTIEIHGAQYPEGLYTIHLIARSAGLIPVEFNLTIMIYKFTPYVETSASWSNKTTLDILLTIKNIEEWKYFVNLRILGFENQVNTVITEINTIFSLNVEKFETLKSLNASLTLTEGKHVYYFSIPVKEFSSSGFSRSGNFMDMQLQISLFLVISPLAFYLTRILKNKYSNEIINF